LHAELKPGEPNHETTFNPEVRRRSLSRAMPM
jgi:hypothetical protein